jgi:adenylosuccinate synthase
MSQRIGSTAEGIGAARSRRLMRQTPIASDFAALEPWIRNWEQAQLVISNPSSRILIESSQGFALSLHYKHYPKCTSGDLMPYQILQDADIPYNLHQVHTHMVCRTFPIRVAGASGYLYGETSWADLRKLLGDHIPEERTTVTNKVRRVGEFDFPLYRDALNSCSPQRVILTFADYLAPELFNRSGTMTHTDVLKFSKSLYTLIAAMAGNVDAIGTGIGTFVYLRDRQRNMGKAEAEYFEFLKSLPVEVQQELLRIG